LTKQPLRGAAKRNALKTHCKRGHEFTEDNTAVHFQNGKESGGRRCKKCAALHARKTWHKRRERINQRKRDKRREERLKREGVL
jgi:hypothetical protein